jgi:HAE1 family hydrophobic/amphiphilic exporter-1
MMLTLFLVIMVIYFFLRNARATLIPSMTLPMSIIGTFIVMYLLDYSLDNLSLMALTLSIGFVVDDAIVMLENIFRHLEMGKSVRQAALDGSKEISFTIISMTLSLSAVFIPVLFMGGIVGRLFQEFGVTIAAAVLVSGLVALTLIPMLCSRFLKPTMLTHAAGSTQQGHAPVIRFYAWSLRWAVRHWTIVLGLSFLVLLGTFGLFKIVPKGFLPNEDMGFLFGQTEGNQGVSYDAMKEHQMAGVKVVQNNPNIESFVTRVGIGGFTLTPNSGMFFLRLTPRSERRKTADEVLQEVRSQMLEIPGFKVFLMNPQPINIGGRATKSQYQYTLQGSDISELYKYAVETEKTLTRINNIFEDVTSDLQNSNPQLSLEINREKASLLNISATQIENALFSAFGSRKISTIYTPDNQYSVLMELKDDYKIDQDSLSLLYVRSQSGKLVPLTDLITFTQGAGPLTINHSGQLPSVTISFNLKPKVSLNQAVDTIEKKIQHKFPASISAKFQGTAEAFKKSMSGMIILLIVTILVIYIILGVLYEDYLHPITILTALPFAGFGAILSLLVCNVELSLYGFIGIIMLVGIVKKNGIMMIDFAIVARREHGKSAQDAIIEACQVRFRPIMMTTAAAIMAGIPLAIGWGAGGEARRPLGITLVGGLLFSQLLTLYVTPVFYVCVEYLRDKYNTKQQSKS